MTDEELVKKVKTGDLQSFSKLVLKYEEKLYWYLKGLINQPKEEIEDLLQEVFIGVYVNIQGFDTSKKFSSWIYRIAHNKSIDYFRKKKTGFKKEPWDIEENGEMIIDKTNKLIEDLIIEQEKAELLQSKINLLPEKYKEIVILYYFEDKSYEEISEILHVSMNKAGVMLYRSREKLKGLLKNEKK